MMRASTNHSIWSSNDGTPPKIDASRPRRFHMRLRHFTVFGWTGTCGAQGFVPCSAHTCLCRQTLVTCHIAECCNEPSTPESACLCRVLATRLPIWTNCRAYASHADAAPPLENNMPYLQLQAKLSWLFLSSKRTVVAYILPLTTNLVWGQLQYLQSLDRWAHPPTKTICTSLDSIVGLYGVSQH
jgi:hypothetical protein